MDLSDEGSAEAPAIAMRRSTVGRTCGGLPESQTTSQLEGSRMALTLLEPRWLALSWRSVRGHSRCWGR
ncbi:MAG: hypothetical protein GY914_04750, partial [Prochlorococcus sp.]|nr:hypothetical protein [Prochlorococcus sp.]